MYVFRWHCSRILVLFLLFFAVFSAILGLILSVIFNLDPECDFFIFHIFGFAIFCYFSLIFAPSALRQNKNAQIRAILSKLLAILSLF